MAKKILLIIHNNTMRSALFEFLTELKYNVKICPDAETSIEMASKYSPDLILCESSLPVIPGRKLAQFFKANSNFAKIPFVLITDLVPTREPAPEERAYRADDYLKIPFDQPSVYSIVSKWLESGEKPETNSEKVVGIKPSASPEKNAIPQRKGRITLAGLGKLLFGLIKDEATGVLTIRQDQRTMTAHVRKGELVDVQSNYIREDTLGRFLTQMNRLTPEEAEATFRQAQEENIHHGEILVRKNLLTQMELDEILDQQKAIKFSRLSLNIWNKATYEFIPRPLEAIPEGMTPRPLSKLLKMLIGTICEEEAIYNVFVKNKKSSTPIVISEDFEEVAKVIDFKETYLKKARALNGQTIDGLKSAIPTKFDNLLRIAFLLLLTKGARFAPTDGMKQTG